MPITNINDADLWFDIIGEGEPLLLHHGYTASRVNWMPVAKRLSDRYQIILMECRGTGDSEHTKSGYSIEQYALDVVGLLDHLKLDRISFAGHSMGGGIGFQLGVHHSDRLNKLILMAPIPSGGIGPIHQAWTSFRELLQKIIITLKDITNISVLMILFMFIFCLVGSEMYGYKVMYNNDDLE